MALGRKIVEELKLDPGVDTLSRWMAHHIAELMDEADKAKGDEKKAKQTQCAELILKMWDRRYQLSDGSRPFGDMEPIFRTLDSLDTNSTEIRHYKKPWQLAREEEENPTVTELMKAIEGIDYSAKLLIRSALVQAAEFVVEKKVEWGRLIQEVDSRSAEVALINFISAEKSLFEEGEAEENLDEIQERVDRLEGLMAYSDRYLDTLKAMLVENEG